MRRIRVLHFMWRLGKGGGIPVFQRMLLKCTNKEHFDLHVFSVRPLYPEDSVEEVSENVTLHPMNLFGNVGPRGQGRIMLELARVTREVRPDVLHTYTGYAWLAIPPDLVGRGIAAKVLDIQSDPYGRQLSWLNTMSQRFMVRWMHYRPVVHSRSTRDHAAGAFAIRPDSLTLIPNGIETAFFAHSGTPRLEWRRLNRIPQDALVVLNVARLVPLKNVALYLEVARRVLGQMSGVVFLIVSDGPLRDALEDSVTKDGLQEKIRFLGYRDDLIDIYHASDLFLSTSDDESFPLTILEAMAAARPVVATSAGGVVEQVLDGSTGRLCPIGDAGALAQATLELLRDPARRTRLGEVAQERAQRLYDIHEIVRQYEELYVRMVDQARSPASTHRGYAG